MKRNRRCVVVVITLAVWALVSCSGTRMYSGPARSKDQVAVLEPTEGVVVRTVDGTVVPGGKLLGGGLLELLPGSHKIEIEYPGGKGLAPVVLRFDAKPGLKYRIVPNYSGGRSPTWNPAVTEATSGTIVSELVSDK